jgi:hypothetical protein
VGKVGIGLDCAKTMQSGGGLHGRPRRWGKDPAETGVVTVEKSAGP